MRFSQNGLQHALARGIFYAETKFHWHWLKDKLRTACRSLFRQTRKNFGVFGPLDPQKCDFRIMDFNLHWPEVFFMLKPNFIGIGREIDSGQLANLQFSKNGKNFGIFEPLDPPKCDFRKMDFILHWPEVFSILEPNFTGIGWELSLIHIWRCRRYAVCRSRWSPYH